MPAYGQPLRGLGVSLRVPRDEPTMTQIIRIAAALLIDPQGQTLLVRKRGTQAFMQPGGKIEAHERPVDALARELHEELGLQIDPLQAGYLGSFSAPAANEPGFEVQAELFRVHTHACVEPAAEIEEAVWVDASATVNLELAPLTRDWILPLYRTLTHGPA
ncbi:DNA mismatch repair protein MutT [Pseudomonas laurentiana]|nr:DNA mismatch repair protein MutT [Pseudomonas laurentiana]